MEIFQELPLEKREYMNYLFRNCTEEMKYYSNLLEVEPDQTFINAGTRCSHIYIVISGKVTAIEWPVDGKPYPFKDFGPGDFFGEIECFAGMPNYRISIVTSTKCRVLSIPAGYYMRWLQMDAEALFLRTKTNIKRLITQTADARKYLFMDGKERLMVHLIRKYEQKQPMPDMLELRKTRNQIAEEIGFCIKTLNRSVSKLEDMGLVEVRKGKIRIHKECYLEMKDYVRRCINHKA